MRLPPGPFYLVGRVSDEPGAVEAVCLEMDGRNVMVFFTQSCSAKAYRDAFPEKNWNVGEITRKSLVGYLAISFRAGIVSVAIDPKPNEPADVIPIFRVILDSE